MTLNEISKISHENVKKRQANGGNVKTDTRSMLKHCATEVVEATEAYYLQTYESLTDAKEHLETDEYAQQVYYEDKAHFASELADIICCCTIIAEEEGINLDKAVADCLEKNRKRAEGTGDKL